MAIFGQSSAILAEAKHWQAILMTEKRLAILYIDEAINIVTVQGRNRSWNQTFELTWNRNWNHTWVGIVHHCCTITVYTKFF